MAAAHAAEARAHHAATLAGDHAAELSELWAHVLAMRVELAVYRQYGTQPIQVRLSYIQAAQRFYAREYETQLTNQRSPAEACRLALLATWRPDR